MKDVHEATCGEDESSATDRHATGRCTFVWVAQYSPGEPEQQERKHPIQASHCTGHQETRDATEAGRDVPPCCEGDQDRQRNEHEAKPVTAMRWVKLTGAVAKLARAAAYDMGDTHPDRGQDPGHSRADTAKQRRARLRRSGSACRARRGARACFRRRLGLCAGLTST